MTSGQITIGNCLPDWAVLLKTVDNSLKGKLVRKRQKLLEMRRDILVGMSQCRKIAKNSLVKDADIIDHLHTLDLIEQKALSLCSVVV